MRSILLVWWDVRNGDQFITACRSRKWGLGLINNNNNNKKKNTKHQLRETITAPPAGSSFRCRTIKTQRLCSSAMFFFFFFRTTKTQNKTKFRHFKKIICIIAATVQCSCCSLGNVKIKTRKKKHVFMHSIPSDSFGKAVIALLRPRRRRQFLPQRTAGSLNVKSFRFHPDGPLRLEPWLSAAPPPRVIVPPAMRNSRPSGTRWGRFAAAVAPLSLGWLVSDREQTHNES